jgi:3-dehydroquinate synthase
MTQQVLSLTLMGQKRQYQIVIQAQGLADLGKAMEQVGISAPRQVMVVYDAGLPHVYLQRVLKSLEAAGFTVYPSQVLQGEGAKDLTVLETLYAQAMQIGLTRQDVFLALGGGVVGDLTGFLAATYYRGTRLVQVPTTLLAQVDSSVGGKVAVNFGPVKNSIGAFKQPELVLIDPSTLSTLPTREIQAGLAELFKYALIEKTALDLSTPTESEQAVSLWHRFQRLEKADLEDPSALIYQACAIKSAVVMRDETESFPPQDARGRVCLNLGHTFAHAYEAYYGYGQLLHGEAVAIGMLCALYANEARCTATDVEAVIHVMETLALLPYQTLASLPPLPTPDALLPFMAKDKKVLQHGCLRLVLPESPIGTVRIQDVTTDFASTGILKAHAYLRRQGR